MWRAMTAGFGCLVAAACAAVDPDGSTVAYKDSVKSYYRKFSVDMPTGRTVTICHGHTCHFRTAYTLTDIDLADMEKLMSAAHVRDGGTERAQVGKVVALMERRVGSRLGTSGDLALNKLMTGAEDPSQTDCVDEAANTTSVLLVLLERGLLRHHRIEKPAVRDRILFPHYTAVLTDTQTGAAWAVDSWFEDNGKPPLVMPLDDWFDYRNGAGPNGV